MRHKLRLFNLILIVVFIFIFTACTIPKTAAETTVAVTTAKGKIAFVSYRDGNAEIYIMNIDGSEQVRLTNNPAEDWVPRFSPDGSKITFESDREGNSEIYIMNTDGSDQVNLTNNQADDGGPSFSPDGSKIAFVSLRDGNSEIYIMNVNGSEQVRLTNNHADDGGPSFSPDGSKIAFDSNRDGNGAIYTMNVDGSEQVNLINNPAEGWGPSFSPDGSKIAFTSDRYGNYEIYTMNVDGSEQVTLTNNPAGDVRPSFSPIPETTAETTAQSAIEKDEYNIGDTGPAGGLIFYVNPNYETDGWRYLEAAPGDQSTEIQWYNGSHLTMGATATAVGTGEANTQTIVKAQGAGSYAAQRCNDLTLGGYSDWFLPSKDELGLMYENLYLKGLGSFRPTTTGVRLRALYTAHGPMSCTLFPLTPRSLSLRTLTTATGFGLQGLFNYLSI